jgi:hypothetical protein
MHNENFCTQSLAEAKEAFAKLNDIPMNGTVSTGTAFALLKDAIGAVLRWAEQNERRELSK